MMGSTSPPNQDGEDGVVTFEQLMALSEIEEEEGKGQQCWRSLHPAWSPSITGNAFGGHVYAQAAWAASQTVAVGFCLHNVHGYFTLAGLVDRPYVFYVEEISNGRRYSTRSVTVRQPVEPGFPPADAPLSELGKICFTCICSFKLDELPGTKHQEVKNWEAQYGSVLKGKRPGDHPSAPRIDAPWYRAYLAAHPSPSDLPGLDIRKVDMSAFNKDKLAYDYRQLSYFRVYGDIPSSQPNLHACAHLFASDRNSLFMISNAMGFGDQVKRMGSLSHSVVFHVGSEGILFDTRKEKDGEKEDEDEGKYGWFCQEAWTPRSEGGRGIHESKIWDWRGVHVASTWQEGMVRKQDDTEGEPRQRVEYGRWLERGGTPVPGGKAGKL